MLLATCVSAQKQAPNVLFLFADDQRPDTVAAFGNEFIQTPAIDTIANRGMRFAHNYCMGSIHGAVCQPSRAMLMSGRSLWRVSMQLRGVPMMPTSFRKAGYETFVTGKWHNGQESVRGSFERGNAVMLGGMSDHLRVPIRDFAPDGQMTKRRRGEKFSSELFADAAIEFLRSRDRARPFFCYVSFTSPHDPRQPPEPYRQHYYDNRPPLPANFMPQHPFHNGWMVGRDEKLAAWPRTESVISDQLAEYYGMITHMDAQIGRILETLRASGDLENTIIVYTADHGLAVGSHGLLGKQNLYEHSMGCPLIFAGPGVPKGTSAALTYLLDLFPTLCSLCGVKTPQGVEGRDLTPVIRGEREGVRETLFTTYEDKMRALRDSRFKLIRYPRIAHTQLFDLQEDPHELNNLAEKPEYATTVQTMRRELERWQVALGDRQPWTIAKPHAKEIDLSGRKRKPDNHQPEWIVEKYFR